MRTRRSPRARDVIVTEYGVADIRGKSDRDTIAAIICVADGNFQDQLKASVRSPQVAPPDHGFSVLLSWMAAPGPTGTLPGVGLIEIAEDNLVAPHLAQEVREHVDRQVLARAAPVESVVRSRSQLVLVTRYLPVLNPNLLGTVLFEDVSDMLLVCRLFCSHR